jgi:hypothetical protein
MFWRVCRIIIFFLACTYLFVCVKKYIIPDIWCWSLLRIEEVGHSWRGELPAETDSLAPFIDPIDDSSDIIDTTDFMPTDYQWSPNSEPEWP